MKILFAGGASGGHFYPIIAVAEALQKLAREEQFLPPELYYMAPQPFDERALFENNIIYRPISAGKMRRYFSLLNFIDYFKTAWGVLKALVAVFRLYPDVIFSKGGYASFPIVFAARVLHIPLIIHESDSHIGRVNRWSAKFANRIAVSYPQTASEFPADKVAITGNPIRHELVMAIQEGAHEFLKLDPNIPVILVLGGSQGAQMINDAILDALPKLLPVCQVIHQTGEHNFKIVSETAKVVLHGNDLAERYRPFPFLNGLALRMAAGVSTVIVTRAGSTIFEIAVWGVPAIVIPIPEGVSHDQTSNAYAYAREGGGIVIEEKNLTPSILVFEVERFINDSAMRARMAESAKAFGKVDAAEKIARQLLVIAASHER